MSYTKMALESTDPSFQCSTKIEMTATDIMLSAEWDMRYERLRDEEEAKSRAAALGIDQEGAALRSANQPQEPLTRIPPTGDVERWIHTTDAARFRAGALFGWRDDSSPTGFLSGYVVRSDHLHLRVLVRDIAPGYMGAWKP